MGVILKGTVPRVPPFSLWQCRDDHIGPDQPTLHSHGLRIWEKKKTTTFLLNWTKGTTQKTRSRPSARSFTALQCIEATWGGSIGPLESAQLQTESVDNQTWCYQNHVAHVTIDIHMVNEEVSKIRCHNLGVCLVSAQMMAYSEDSE